jgi:ribonuclease HI
MILYSFYIAPLLEIADGKKTTTIGFVDDTTLVAKGKTFTETHQLIRDLLEKTNGALEWSHSHDSPFEISKLALMDFTHSADKRLDSRDLEFTMKHRDGTTSTRQIERVDTYKILGVMIDSKLTWRHHHDLVQERALKWTALFCRLNRTTKGLPMELGRRLYIAVAIPRITYAAEIWYTPPHKPSNAKKKQGDVRLTNKLGSIQRKATIAITGAMRTTAGDILEMHTNLFSARTLLLNAIFRAATRLATLSTAHPLTPHIRKCSRRLVRKHRSALHYIFYLTDIDPEDIEKIESTRRPPSYRNPFQIRIEEEELATEWDSQHFGDEIMIYSDGSGYKDMIGAAAVMYSNEQEVGSLRFLLGPITEHTVFEGELVGVLLGMHLASKIRGRRKTVNISLDNQAAIQALTDQRPQPAHKIMDEIHSSFERFMKEEESRREDKEPNIRRGNQLRSEFPTDLTLTWVPGHEGRPGNERADHEAKLGVKGRSSDKKTLPTFLHTELPHSASATNQRLRGDIKKAWNDEWKSSSRYRRFKHINAGLPAKRFTKVTHGLRRREISTMIQLRTSHIPLNAHLHQINQINHPSCSQCETDDIEDIQHYLFICPRYQAERHTLERELKRDAQNLSFLLGDPTGVKELLKYIKATGRFNSTLMKNARTSEHVA